MWAFSTPTAIRIINNDSGIIRRSTRFDDIAEAYLNTLGEMTLTGSAGTADFPIFVLPRETTILNLKGDSDFYIKGINDASKSVMDGNNKLSAVNVGTVGGNFELNNDLDKVTVNFADDKSTGDIKINQTGDIALEGALNGNVLSLTSEKGGLKATKEI